MENSSNLRQYYNKSPNDIKPKTSLMTPISYHLNHSVEKFDPKQNSQRVTELSSRRMNLGNVHANIFGGQQAS